MRKHLFIVLAAMLAVFPVSTMAWSNPGHMAVAGLAYQSLDSDTKARVDELVAMNPRVDLWRQSLPAGASAAKKRMMLFMIAATWADQIKSAGGYHADGLMVNGHLDENRPPDDDTADQNIGYADKAKHKYWHFIDLAFSQNGGQTPDPPDVNAETRINAFREVLADPNAGDELKSYDLMWLLHLVGDVHQPLHGAERFIAGNSKGDGGGNSVKVTSCAESGECGGSSLHSYWDGIFGSTNDLKLGRRLAFAAMDNAPAAPAAAANNLNTHAWILESFNLAKTVVYKDPPIKKNRLGTFALTDEYQTAAITEGNKRLALAGARLGRILNQELR